MISYRSVLCASVLLLWGCPEQTPSQDADVDTDVCEGECCSDPECSNLVFCDGVERCVDGQCQDGEPIACDDETPCTVDTCNEDANRCEFIPNHDSCDDGDRCTLNEKCDPDASNANDNGCIPGDRMVCDDEDPCTVDFCENGRCEKTLRDADNDGFQDQSCALCDDANPPNCERGTDCNDANDTVYPGATEVCDDGEDNDCDRLVDYSEAECTVPNDTCGSALEIVSNQTIFSSTRQTTASIDTQCGGATDPDVAFNFTTEGVQDVAIEVNARSGTVTTSLTTICDDPGAEIRCIEGRNTTLQSRGLVEGTYAVVISSEVETDFDITLSLSEPIEVPPGDLCTSAVDIGGGGHFDGDTSNMLPDYDSRCGEPTDLDIAYGFSLQEAMSLELEVTAGSAEVAVAIQQECGVANTERGCFATDDTVSRRYRYLAPGDYFLIFKTEDPDTFSFSVTFGDPETPTLESVVDATSHTEAVLSAGNIDDGQYNIDIAPLAFPFNGTTYDCVAVSTNGYLRFGNGSCPSADEYDDRIDDIHTSIPQLSFMTDDSLLPEGSVRYDIDETEQRVVITITGHYRRSYSRYRNDLQLVLACDSGDIQVSYVDCTFGTGTASGFYWNIGVSTPDISGGTLHEHDFPAHTSGQLASFGPGAITQSPRHNGPDPYLPLNGRAILFLRDDDGWTVHVDTIPE